MQNKENSTHNNPRLRKRKDPVSTNQGLNGVAPYTRGGGYNQPPLRFPVPPFTQPPYPPPFGINPNMPPPMLDEDGSLYEEIEIDESHLDAFKQAGYEEAENSQENEDIDYQELTEEEVEEINNINNPLQEEEIVIEPKKGKELIEDDELKEKQRDSLIQARKTEAIAAVEEKRISFIKIILIILFSGGLLSSIGLLITWVLTTSKANIYTDGDSFVDTSLSPEVRDELKFWKLPNSESNNILKEFYKTIGLFETISKSNDELMRGSATIEGKNYAVRVIKNRSGNTYLKTIDAGEISAAYFLPEYTLGRKLLTGTISGASQALEFKDNELLRSLFIYDELLLAKAFPFSGISADSRRVELEIGKTVEIESIPYNTLKVIMPTNTYTYYFDKESKRLIYISYNSENMDFLIKFSDFRGFSDNLTFPAIREIFVNKKLYAVVKYTAISRINEMLLFPH